ncbi:MAG: IS1595 family transposase [Treponema sp.]|nr:IS1595 family transposase [Treponema sp.]
MEQNEKLEILTQLFLNLSESEKENFFARIAGNIHETIKVTSEVKQTKSSLIQSVSKKAVCSVCGSSHVVRNGWKCNVQQYLCRDCGKSFGDTENTILKSTKKKLDVWRLYIKCMVEKMSLRKCAEVCNMNLKTAFLWRHKILDALQNMMNAVQLNGVVEADETFTAISYKGQKLLPRKPHKRGEKAEKRGLSKEKVCIPCGINMNGLSVAKISNLGKPSWKDIQSVLGGKIEKQSILVTDSFKGYHKLASKMEVTHIRIPRKKHTSGTFNIQLLNNYHSQLKKMINDRFNGVSTKYLNNYLVYHNMVNFSNGNDAFKEETMFRFTMTTNYMKTRNDVFCRPLIPTLDTLGNVKTDRRQ